MLPLFNNNPTQIWVPFLEGVVEGAYTPQISLEEHIIHIHKGDRVAQLCIEFVPDTELVEVGELPDSDRGEGSFGSTGVHERL